MPNRQPSIVHPVGDAKLFNGINATFFGRLFFREFLGSPERGEVFVVASRSQRMFSADVYKYKNYFKKNKDRYCFPFIADRAPGRTDRPFR